MESSLGGTGQPGSQHGADFLSEYKAISSKLKKRFLRRPNVAEANEQFTKLGKRLKNDDEPQYEAMCHLAVARCEQSVGNSPAEAEALIAASRSFLTAENKIREVGCPSLQEYITAAIHSYSHAIRILEESGQSCRAAGLCLELATALRGMGKSGEALTFYQRAADLRSETVVECMRAREKVAECHIDAGDYHNALVVLTKVSGMSEQHGGRPLMAIYADFMKRCEVLRVLLLLLIEPTAQNISPGLTVILEKYAWESEDSATADETSRYLSDELFLLLQSLVMAVQVRDSKAIRDLEDHLAPHLSTQPRTLLRRLVKNMQDKFICLN